MSNAHCRVIMRAMPFLVDNWKDTDALLEALTKREILPTDSVKAIKVCKEVSYTVELSKLYTKCTSKLPVKNI